MGAEGASVLEKHLAHTLVPGHPEGPGDGTVWGSGSPGPARLRELEQTPPTSSGGMGSTRRSGQGGTRGLQQAPSQAVCQDTLPCLAPHPGFRCHPPDSGQRSSCRQAPSSRQRLVLTPSCWSKSPFPATPLPAPSPGRPPPTARPCPPQVAPDPPPSNPADVAPGRATGTPPLSGSLPSLYNRTLLLAGGKA